MSREKLLINDSKSNNSEVMSNKQIEEMAKIITKNSYLCKGEYIRTTGKHNRDHCEDCDLRKACLSYDSASEVYNAGYRKQSEGEWIIGEFESPVCSACGKVSLKNGYEEYVKSNFCPHCGAKMKGEIK